MKSSAFFLLVCSMAVCQMKEYIYIPKNMDWFSAQKYCRENYVDLATITTDMENQILYFSSAAFSSVNGWIGLYRTKTGSNIWKWSDGTSSNFFKWAPGQPDNTGGIESCVMVWSTGWNDFTCNAAQPFYCSWRFVLVNEPKTWDEALDYCRTYYTGLASPFGQPILAENATAQTQTVSVWTGLRFVNGQWVSVNMLPLGRLISLPTCPALPYRCGAYNNNTQLWENRDCNEKLNFLCY